MKHTVSLVLILGTCLTSALQTVDFEYTCSEDEWNTAEKRFDECANSIKSGEELSYIMFDEPSYVCSELENMLNTCMKHFEKCLLQREIRNFKDSLIESVISFLDGASSSHLYKSCAIVKEYIDSGRNTYKATEKCNAREVEEVTKESGRCAREQQQDVLSNVIGSNRPQSKTDMFHLVCAFVTKGHDCLRVLSKCYDEKEIELTLDRSLHSFEEVFTPLKVDFSVKDCTQALSLSKASKIPSGVMIWISLLLSYLITVRQ